LIARNEASVITGCLESIQNHVDEIIVVDTGSSDETTGIAAHHGAKIVSFPWIDDFAAARNCALDAATSDWILYIDADERLVVPQGISIRDELGAPGVVALRMRLQPRTGFSAYHEVRLFRRDRRIRFVGLMHERIIPSLMAVCAEDRKRIAISDLGIVHIGYDSDQTHKHHRNLPLLRRAVIENPDRVYCWWHLGATLAGLGQLDNADAAWARAIEVAERSTIAQEQAEASAAYQARAKLALERGLPALPIIEEGLRKRPSDHALKLIKARALIDLGEEKDAIALLDELLSHDPATFFDPSMAFDLRIFGEFASELKGWACFRLGRFQDSAEAYSHAAAVSGDNLIYRVKAAAAAGRIRQPVAPA
jgi:hypothetical protein